MNLCHPNIAEPWEFILGNESRSHIIFGNQIQYLRIEVPEGGRIGWRITCPSMPIRQDHSLRVTLTTQPVGVSIQWGSLNYHSVGLAGLSMRMSDYTLPSLSDTVRDHPVGPGSYYLNIQNMSNAASNWQIEFENILPPPVE